MTINDWLPTQLSSAIITPTCFQSFIFTRKHFLKLQIDHRFVKRITVFMVLTHFLKAFVMSILGADISFLRQICIDKSFLNKNNQIQEQTANILGKVSEANWDDIQPENHKLLFFACRQYLGVCLQRQVGLENLLAKKINHKLENTQPYQNKDVALDSDETCKSLILNQRSSIEEAIECTSETLT